MNECNNYLSGTYSVLNNNTLTLDDPNYILPEENEKTGCKDEMAGFDPSVKELISLTKTDYLHGADSESINLVTLEDPSYVSSQIVEDQLISNEEIMYLRGDNSMPHETAMSEESNYVPNQVNFSHTDSEPTKILELKDPNCLQSKQELFLNNVCGTDSLAPQNTVKLEDPSCVSLQVVADMVDQLISDEEIVCLGITDSVTQKTLTLKEPVNQTEHVLVSNEETGHFSEADSMQKNTAYDDTNHLTPKQNKTSDNDLCVKKIPFNDETGYSSGTDSSVPQNTLKPEDPSHVSLQVVTDMVDHLISDEEIVYLGSTFSEPQKTLTRKEPNIPTKRVLVSNEETGHLSEADSVPNNTDHGDSNYFVPQKKLKVVCKNETDLCDRKVTCNEETECLNGTNSVPQISVKLEYPNYVSSKVVAGIKDKLIPNEDIYLGSSSGSVPLKTEKAKDRNYVKHEVDFDHADPVPQKTTSKDPDYVPPQQVFENEKDDIIDPRWKTVKELTSNEERYEQVKACWESSTVPDPDKNLTYHSFRRKKLIRSGELKPRVKQHKRKATSTLTNETKRPCTYLVDKEISELVRQKEEKSKEIQKEMRRVIDELRERQYREEICYGSNMAYNDRSGGRNTFARTYQNTILSNMRHEHRREIIYIQNKYNQKNADCTSRFEPKLNELENIRQEVLQFYTFYKGMGINVEKDPTVLTDFQLKMLNDIENFYKQMKSFYK